MLATLLLVSSSMIGQTVDTLPRVARTLGLAGTAPQVITTWHRADSAGNNPSILATVTPLAAVPNSPTPLGGTTLPQETLTTANGTFAASSPNSPDADIDELGNTVVVWVAMPPYDPSTSPAPTGNEIYLSYNGQPPFRVSTDQTTPYATAYGTFQVSSQYASIARVAISRDGRRIAVGWSSGGDNLGVNAVNAVSVFARTYTVGSPGAAASIVPDGLPVLVTPAFASSTSNGYPGSPPQVRFTAATGPYHFGDIASDKSDSSDGGYIVLSYVRQASWDGSYYGIPQTLPDGIFVKGYDWGLNPTFPAGGGEQALSPGQGSAYYSFSELDAAHAADGSGWFVVGYSVSATLYAARFTATGSGPQSATSTGISLPNGSTGWGFSVAARSNAGGGTFLVTQETHYPDTYGISVVHNIFGASGTPGGTVYDWVSPSYAVGSKRYTNPNAVLYDNGINVGIAFEGDNVIYQYGH